nr:retrovirus-related Pol polyprotein from transposon TNT 1-94 [Tanacetum cinerariifolium]
GNPQHALNDKGVIDSGCSRHMIRSISYLSDFEELNGGYVAFSGNPNGGKITDTECIVLSFDFMLPDDNHVLLRVPRENNMYNVDLKNIVPLGDLTCLFAKTTLDEVLVTKPHNKTPYELLLGRRPSIRFVRPFGCPVTILNTLDALGNQPNPSAGIQEHFDADKVGEENVQQYMLFLLWSSGSKDPQKNDANATFKVKEPEYEVYVSPSSSAKTKKHDDKNTREAKGKSLVELSTRVSNFSKEFEDFSDNNINRVNAANSPITTVGENSTNNTNTFSAADMPALEDFTYSDDEEDVGAEADFSNLETNINVSPIPTIRVYKDHPVTQIIDSLLPIPFWPEAINTACYVQNRVKPYNKTPYELLLGRTPSIGFMRPFGCPVTILNTLDPLGKFDGKDDEGFLVGYSVSRSGPTWLFDIDTLTKYMNYQPVLAGNQPNSSADPQNTYDDTTFEVKEPESEVHVSPSSSTKTKKHDDKTKREAKGKSLVELSTGVRILSEEFKDFSDNSINEVNAASTPVPDVGQNSTNSTNTISATDMPALEDITYFDDEEDVGATADFSNLETNITVSPIPTTRVHKDHHVLVDLPKGKRAIGSKWVFRNKKDERDIVIRNKARLVAQGHTQEEGIDYEEVFAPVARIEAIRLFLADASFMGFMVYHMDVKSAFLYGTIKEDGYVCQPTRFEDLEYPDKVYKVVKALYELHQASRAWYETLANYLLENDLCKAFEKLMKDKFQMSSMGELTFFLGLQVKHKKDGIFMSQDKYVAKILRKFRLTDGKLASTPIDTEKPLLKDPNDEDVNVHTYRLMIGSLMYLTSSRPDIMFAICTVVATSSTEAEYVAAAS